MLFNSFTLDCSKLLWTQLSYLLAKNSSWACIILLKIQIENLNNGLLAKVLSQSILK